MTTSTRTLRDVNPGRIFCFKDDISERDEPGLYYRTSDGEHIIILNQRQKGQPPGFHADLTQPTKEIGYAYEWEGFVEISDKLNRGEVITFSHIISPEAGGRGP